MKNLKAPWILPRLIFWITRLKAKITRTKSRLSTSVLSTSKNFTPKFLDFEAIERNISDVLLLNTLNCFTTLARLVPKTVHLSNKFNGSATFLSFRICHSYSIAYRQSPLNLIIWPRPTLYPNCSIISRFQRREPRVRTREEQMDSRFNWVSSHIWHTWIMERCRGCHSSRSCS